MRRKVHIKIVTKFAVHEMASLSNEILEFYKTIDHLTVSHNAQSALNCMSLLCSAMVFILIRKTWIFLAHLTENKVSH